MKRIVTGAVLIVLLVLSAAAGTAQAASCGNCYARGYITNTGSSYGGGYVQIAIRQLTTPDWPNPVQGHINQTIWVTTDNTTRYSATPYWAEIGYTYGYHGTLSSDPTGMTYYWARNNPVNGYADFSLGRIDAVGTTHEFEAQQVFNGEYDVYLDGVDIGSDVNGGNWTLEVDTGLEYTDTAGTIQQTNFDWHQTRSTACCAWSYWSTGATQNDFSYFTWTWTTLWNHAYNQ